MNLIGNYRPKIRQLEIHPKIGSGLLSRVSLLRECRLRNVELGRGTMQPKVIVRDEDNEAKPDSLCPVQ